MKKSLRILTLALICSTPALAAEEQVKTVTPVNTQTDYLVDSTDPRAQEVCSTHLKAMRGKSQAMADLAQKGCEKVGQVFYDAIQKGAEACLFSFNTAVRSVMQNSFEENFKARSLQCDRASAVAACEECRTSIQNVVAVTMVMSTKEIDASLGMYAGLLSKLQEVAQSSGCTRAKPSDMKEAIAKLSSELKLAQPKVMGWHAGKLAPPVAVKDAPLPPPQKLGETSTELAPITVGSTQVQSASDASGSIASTGASTDAKIGAKEAEPSVVKSGRFGTGPDDVMVSPDPIRSSGTTQAASADSKLPEGLTVFGDAENGGAGFVYEDPAHNGKNLIGVQIKDPSTGKIKSYAYPVSVDEVKAIKKDPTLFNKALQEAHAQSATYDRSENDALERGDQFFASLNQSGDKPENQSGKTGVDKTSEAKKSGVIAKRHTPHPVAKHQSGSTSQQKLTAQQKPASQHAATSSNKAKDSKQAPAKHLASAAKKKHSKSKPRKIASASSKKPAGVSAGKSDESKNSPDAPYDIGSVRYFLKIEPPRKPRICREITVNGYTETVIYDIPAGEKEVRALSQNNTLLKNTFENIYKGHISEHISGHLPILIDQGDNASHP